MYNNILIAFDGSDLAQKAVLDGLKLAKQLDSSVTFVTVTELWSTLGMAVEPYNEKINPTESYEAIQDRWAEKVLADAADKAQKLGVACETIHKVNEPAEGIIEVAKTKGCDLIVMASHGRRGFKKILLGSVANEVTTLSPVPVLVIR